MPSADPSYDVAIIGGALSGAATAILLLEAEPKLRVVVFERPANPGAPCAEATPELAAFFLGRVLGLGAHLNEDHHTRTGARWLFAGGDSLETCSEIGNKYLARLPAYLIDRALLDAETNRRATALGAEFRRESAVARVELASGGTQTLTLENGERASARWVVDASGGAALLARQEGWHRPNLDHPTRAVWGRWRGVKNWDAEELRQRFPNFAKATYGPRNTAVNYLTGDGWWSAWFPLRSGEVSIRVSGDPRLAELPASTAEVRMFLEARHPAARELLAGGELVANSEGARNQPAFSVKRVAGDGWALVGGAAGHIDTLYGHDQDWTVRTVMAAVGLILAERRNAPGLPERIAGVNLDAELGYQRQFDAVFRDKYQCLGDFELMRVAYLFDFGLYTLRVASAPFLHGAALLSEPPPRLALGELVSRRCAAIARVRRTNGTLGRRNAGRRMLFTSFNFNTASGMPLLGAALAWLRLELAEGRRSRR